MYDPVTARNYTFNINANTRAEALAQIAEMKISGNFRRVLDLNQEDYGS